MRMSINLHSARPTVYRVIASVGEAIPLLGRWAGESDSIYRPEWS